MIPFPRFVGVSPVLNGVIQRATAKLPAGRLPDSDRIWHRSFSCRTEWPGQKDSIPLSQATQCNGPRSIINQPRENAAPLLTSPDAWARQQPVAPPNTNGFTPFAHPTSPGTCRESSTGNAHTRYILPTRHWWTYWGSRRTGRGNDRCHQPGVDVGKRKPITISSSRGRSADYVANNNKAGDLYRAGKYEQAAALFRVDSIVPNGRFCNSTRGSERGSL